MDGCADESRRKQSKVVTTNPIYHCEELEDAASVYHEIEQNQYDVLEENKIYIDVLPDQAEKRSQDNVYVDVLPNETEKSDQESKPKLPSPRPVAESQYQNQDRGYDAVNDEKPDSIYTRMSNDDVEGCNQDIEPQDTSRGASATRWRRRHFLLRSDFRPS